MKESGDGGCLSTAFWRCGGRSLTLTVSLAQGGRGAAVPVPLGQAGHVASSAADFHGTGRPAAVVPSAQGGSSGTSGSGGAAPPEGGKGGGVLEGRGGSA